MPLSAMNTMGTVPPVKANVAALCAEVIERAEDANPGHYIRTIWGYDPNSQPEHSAGTALDFMCDPTLGDWIADYLWDNRDRLGLRWEIWEQRIRSTSPGKPGTWVPMADRGSTTQNHYDHVHANFWEKDYQGPNDSSTGSGAGGGVTPPPPQPAEWDGTSYPGADAFKIGSYHPATAVLGRRLVAHGYGRFYKVGPGVPMGQADVDACAQFQRDQGWTGSDANGYPGPVTWGLLMADPHGQDPVDSVSLDHIRVAILKDGPAPTGSTSGFEVEVRLVEQALADEGLLDGRYVDGSAGSSTFGPRSAYQRWQVRCGYSGAGADGYPGRASLTTLGEKHGFSVS